MSLRTYKGRAGAEEENHSLNGERKAESRVLEFGMLGWLGLGCWLLGGLSGKEGGMWRGWRGGSCSRRISIRQRRGPDLGWNRLVTLDLERAHGIQSSSGGRPLKNMSM